MGKIAEPSTLYCGAFTSAALSVNGATYSTDNPPIRYTLSGVTATIYDGSDAVIATADLSGSLVSVGTQAASEGVEYCGGKPRAKLSWSSGSIETANTPVSFSITESFVAGSEVSFSGQISYSATTLPSHTAPSGKVIVAIDDSGTSYKFGSTSDFPTLTKFVGVEVPKDLGLTEYVVRTSNNTRFAVYDQWIAGYLAPVENIVFNFDGNLPDNSGNIRINFEYRNKITTYELILSDSSGVIATYGYESEPTDFTATCYDYDIKEASYACQGECPAGAEWQCKCPETNSLSCYGFDPLNPNVFKPLFTTQITG